MKPLAVAVALAVSCLAPAQGGSPASGGRAEALLDSLTLEQKAGQLFVAWSLTRSAEVREDGKRVDNHERLLRQVRAAGLGGVILSLGTVEEAARLTPRLQAAAEIPLLLAGDFEGGVWFRLRGATELGNQMLLGAGRSEHLAEEAGRVTAEEAGALGFQWVFAPVLDVNSNPDNPIINVRSFGEDPDLVARLGSAFARGVREVGLLPCGKHFPGHGDVSTDSHLALATVPGDGDRLRRIELHPFAVAAREGLESVMTGHLAVPGLGEDPNVPATLSHRILHGVLREELGFEGLIVTDALEMGGVKNAFPPGEVAVRALLAGADVLLMPPDPLRARAAVVAAVESGRVPRARLDEAVLRILRAKERVGLLDGRGVLDSAWRSKVRRPESVRLAARIARRGLTLVRDRGDSLPLGEKRADEVLVTILDREEGQGERFETALGESRAAGCYRVSPASAPDGLEVARKAVAGASRVVLALHIKTRAYSDGIGIPPAVRPVLEALRDDQDVVAVSFGNPYLIRDLPLVDTYVCAYVAEASTEEAAARLLLGGEPSLGRLPVSIPDVAPYGHGLIRYPPWSSAFPAPSDGFDALRLALRERLERAVADGAFPGAVCLIARDGEPLARLAVGRLTYDEDAPAVTPATPYDLASLTKVCATTPVILRLCAAGEIALDDPVQKYLPAFRGEGKERVTIRHLLAHCGGLPSYVRFFRTLRGKKAIVTAAEKEGLMVEPGTRTIYSDVGFTLLMAVVEAVRGEPFEEVARHEVFEPLGMSGAHFVPTDGPPLAGAAPTENDPDRGGIVRGYVHDENAYAMGGVSGHAGLFATADDVMRIGRMLLQQGRGFLPRGLVETALRPVGLVPGDRSRGLGYQILRAGSWAGSETSPGAFGHTGFTGTSLWCDPELGVCVVLLTNRVHPTRVNNRITSVRRDVHDLVRAALR